VIVVTGRCSKMKQGFGIRFEETGEGLWTATWCFALSDNVARREGYDKQEIKGSFRFAKEFPGCPHCGNQDFFLCSCEKVGCKGSSDQVTCPWCGRSGIVQGTAEKVSAGRDA
jgi:transcription elongation factor Elf1